MRIAVCDDDQNFCKEMLKYLQGYFKEKKLRQPEYVCFSSGEAMMKAGICLLFQWRSNDESRRNI